MEVLQVVQDRCMYTMSKPEPTTTASDFRLISGSVKGYFYSYPPGTGLIGDAQIDRVLNIHKATRMIECKHECKFEYLYTTGNGYDMYRVTIITLNLYGI